MVNRILWSAAITLALTFSPNLAFSTPTKTVKKKSSKPQEKIAKKSKTCKSSKSKKTRSHADPEDLPGTGSSRILHGSQLSRAAQR